MTALMFCLSLAQADDAAAKAALDAFAKAYKAKESTARVAAVEELAKTGHVKVLAKLATVLASPDAKDVRTAAAKGLGVVREDRDLNKKAIEYLSKCIPPNANDTSIVVVIFEVLEKMAEGNGVAIFKQHMASTSVEAAKGAVDGAGQTKDKRFVMPLIELLRYVEAAARQATNTGPGGRPVVGGGIPGTGGVPDPDAPRRARALVPAIHRALENITGATQKSTKDWLDWWRQNQDAYK
jgi:hypothetical protein